MWGDIILSLTTSVSEAVCVEFMNRKKVEKLNKKFSVIIEKLFDEFADSSLDNNQFARVVSSKPFEEMLRNYFFSIRDGQSYLQYSERFEEYICKEDSTLQRVEVRRFIKKIYELYTEFLHNIIEENCELNAAVQLLTASHRELLGKIIESEENLQKYVKSLDRSSLKISNNDILQYHINCKKEFNKVRFTGISGAEDKTVQDLDIFYVENIFSYYSKDIIRHYELSSEKFEEVHLENFFDYGNKVVLIGAAGLGKSTTLNYLFCNYEKIFNANSLKLKIDLKEYAEDIVNDKRDILWCLATEFSKRIKRTELQFFEIERIIAEFLDKGDCLVILDALDEISTQSMRNKVRSVISSFCELYYLNRFIISTREVGYLRNRFDDSFLHIKINEFNNDQIKKYSANWFKTNYKQGEFDEFWKKFEIEVKNSKCSDLIRNPIVLILALIIFDIEKNLPNRRVEFYKKCIDTFLIVREDRKAAFILTEKIKNILGDDLVIPKVAHHKFERIKEDSRYKFTREEVKNAIMEAIEVPDKINWREPVNQYTCYLVDRTELLGEVDEDKFDFAHKTFYEYFLAIYFSKELENQELAEVLKKWIGDSNNDELARLIIEVIIEKNEPRQHKFIIEFLFSFFEEECEKTREEYSKETDVFLIIADLYKNNMLLPKFHKMYYKSILYHAWTVNSIENRRISRNGFSKVQYDVDILTQYFVEEVAERDNFNNIIDSMYNLSKDFRNKVVQKKGDDVFRHILQLFISVQNNVKYNEKKKDIQKLENECQYFLEHQRELVLNCPQIYMCVVDMIVLSEKDEIISELLSYKFKPHNVFYNYTSPTILSLLLYSAFSSPERFLLLFISLVQCGKTCTNDLLVYVLHRRRWNDNKESNSEKEDKCCENAMVFWQMLNQKENYQCFKDELKRLNVFKEKYNDLYERLFDTYKKNEVDICRQRIEKTIEKELKKQL